MKAKDRRVGKGCRCWLGTHLNAALIPFDIWTKVCVSISILVGWWFGMVWTRWSSFFPKHPYMPSSRYFINLLFHIIQEENRYSAVRNCIKSVPQTAATTFLFSSVFILLLQCICTMYTVQYDTVWLPPESEPPNHRCRRWVGWSWRRGLIRTRGSYSGPLDPPWRGNLGYEGHNMETPYIIYKCVWGCVCVCAPCLDLRPLLGGEFYMGVP